MPQQMLRRAQAPSTATRSETEPPPPLPRPRLLPLRRVFLIGATIAITAVAGYEMYAVFGVGGLTLLETIVLALFVILFAWISFSSVSALVGCILQLAEPRRDLGIDPTAPLPAIGTRNALLLPTYNEDPRHVMARLQAIYESVAETGEVANFDFFVLSDTRDPDIWIAEEAAYLELVRRTGSAQIFYRHRAANIGRKAGNIAEWVSRFGGRYANMIVLDADSLMTGDAVVRLIDALDRHPHVALIQTLPVIVNGTTLFARLQQFAARLYGATIARGIAWWHGPESNYWGHNAAIRVAVFARHAGLPTLSGRKPFGGHILSHDFVEAALMRRAGWAIQMAPDLAGSYEETPPALSDYMARDRRWCQGNLQHLGVLAAHGLHWVSRLHLLMGIGSYVTAPLWVAMLLTGLLISLQARFIRPEYFPPGFSLFPNWPAQDPVRAAWVFGATMAILVLPKVLSVVAVLVQRDQRRAFGGGMAVVVGSFFEILLSALIAPVMMLSQSRSVVDVLLGRDSGWQVQRREADIQPLASSLRRFVAHTAVGAVLAAAAYAVSPPLFFWMTPVTLGLLLAVPIASFTSSDKIGHRLKRLRLLLTPEDRERPKILARANELRKTWGADETDNAIVWLSRDPELRETHRAMQASPPPRPRGEVDIDLAVARAKLESFETLEDAIAFLTPAEKMAALNDPPTLERLLSLPKDAPSRA